MSDMIKDSSEGISFVCNHIAEYGGDPNRIYLMGQSAGAHIAACSLLEQAIKEAGDVESTSWSVSQLKAYFGLSGGYNLFNLVDHFHSRGLYRSIFLSIMEGEQSIRRFFPEVMVQDPNIKNAVSLLPPVVLFHGTGDYSIPSDASKNFAGTLQRVGGKAESIFYDGRTHTDIFVQYLDENKSLILKIVESQNSGKLNECAENQARLQKNLMYLAAIADSQPQPHTMHSQPGSHYLQHQQAQQMPSQSLMAASSSMLYSQQQFLALQQQQALHSQLGMKSGGSSGLHMLQSEANSAGSKQDIGSAEGRGGSSRGHGSEGGVILYLKAGEDAN